MLGMGIIPVAFGSLGTGLMFATGNIALARNPDMDSRLFTNCLVGFALIETFLIIGIVASFLFSIVI